MELVNTLLKHETAIEQENVFALAIESRLLGV